MYFSLARTSVQVMCYCTLNLDLGVLKYNLEFQEEFNTYW